MSSLKFTDAAHWEAIERHLSAADGERFAFAHTRTIAQTPSGPVLEVTGVDLVPDSEMYHNRTGWYLTDEALDRTHNAAVTGGYGLVEFHNHRLGPPRFSDTDEAGLEPMAIYTTDVLPGSIYGAGVYAQGTVHVDWWVRTNTGDVDRGTFTTVTVIGDRLRLVNAPPIDNPRAARQVALLGLDGQAAISVLRVAVVGAGGTGSHVVQALAYLGVTDIRVFDDDIVEESNLNRMVTAGHADVGAPKNLVTQTHVSRIDPNITITPLPAVTPNSDHPELIDTDLIIGCLDHDGPRDLLNQFALDNATPYIDLATGVDTSIRPPVVGGRVILVSPGSPCLHCHHELDPAEITRWAKNSEQKDLDRRHGYGTGLPNASVVHLNGITVYSAITELTAWVAGTRAPAQYLDIDLSGYLATDPSNPGVRVTPRHPITANPNCFACSHRQRATQ